MAYTILSASQIAQPRFKRIASMLGIAMLTSPTAEPGPTTPQILFGTGVPTEAAPNGSIAIRQDGGNLNQVIYARQGGAWVAGDLGAAVAVESQVIPDLTLGAEVANRVPVTISLSDLNGNPVARVQRLICEVLDDDMKVALAAAFTLDESGPGAEISNTAQPRLLIDTDANGDAVVGITDVSGVFAGVVIFQVTPVSTSTNVPGFPRIVAVAFA